MKKSELIELLSSSDEEEVFIYMDNTCYEIDTEFEHIEAAFDGFTEFYPEAIGLKPVSQ